MDEIPEDKQAKLKCDIQSDKHIPRLAGLMIGWEEKFHLFDLTHNPDVHDITRGRNRDNLPLQR